MKLHSKTIIKTCKEFILVFLPGSLDKCLSMFLCRVCFPLTHLIKDSAELLHSVTEMVVAPWDVRNQGF